VSKPVNGDEFLVRDARRVRVIADPLKASVASPIMQFADNYIEFNELQMFVHTHHSTRWTLWSAISTLDSHYSKLT
jgi:hypothetical protein